MLKTLSLRSYDCTGSQYSSHLRILQRNPSLVRREQHTELCCRDCLLLCEQHIRLCLGDSKWRRASLCRPAVTSGSGGQPAGRARQGSQELTHSQPALHPSRAPSQAHRVLLLQEGKSGSFLGLCTVGTQRLLFALQLTWCHLSQIRLQWQNLGYREKGAENTTVFSRYTSA